MGFFKWLGRMAGKGIEKLGDVTGIGILSDTGRLLQDVCAEEISCEKSYDSKKADTNTVERLNDTLLSFSEGYLQRATDIENYCIEEAEKFCDAIIGIIENTSEIESNRLNLKSLKNSKKRLMKEISGGIKDPVAKRMSLDDAECLKILKMDSGIEKKNAMTSFMQKVMKEAQNNLAKSVRGSLEDMEEEIAEFLNNVSEEQEKELANLKETFDRLCQKDSLEESEQEQKLVLPLIVMDAVEEIEKVLA